MQPLIGITTDHRGTGRYESKPYYSQAVARAGGVPILLPHQLELVEAYLDRCHAIILTGGQDPVTEPFGHPTDPRADRMCPHRQAFELAILEAIAHRPHLPTLGICLGVQIMALHAGGSLNQQLADTLGHAAAERHRHDNEHTLLALCDDSVLTAELAAPPAAAAATRVKSSHRQAVENPGRLRVVATAPDGTIEALDDPTRPFYLGVQWHPERGDPAQPALNAQLFHRFVAAARATTSPRSPESPPSPVPHPPG